MFNPGIVCLSRHTISFPLFQPHTVKCIQGEGAQAYPDPACLPHPLFITAWPFYHAIMATASTSRLDGLGLPSSHASTDITDSAADYTSVRSLSSSSTVISIDPEVKAPFDAIRHLFDHLRVSPDDASALNAAYPKRGIFKSAAVYNASSDQKYTIDLSPARNGQIPEGVRTTLAGTGFDEVLSFFEDVHAAYVNPILSTLSKLTDADFSAAHQNGNVNYRLCDYNPDTADPESDNGCGAHTDYGTFSIIFQDGTPGLEMEDAEKPGVWIPVPGDATVVLAGWCAVILSGASIRATRHRVRRTPGLRRLSAVLFVAPDLDIDLKPLEGIVPARPFSRQIMDGGINVGAFKEVVGRKWRRREGNEEMEGEQQSTSQDVDIESLIWS